MNEFNMLKLRGSGAIVCLSDHQMRLKSEVEAQSRQGSGNFEALAGILSADDSLLDSSA
jgi:hypothetical protein